MKRLRVLLADDHALVRAGFSSLLEKLGFEVVGEAEDGNQVIHMVEEFKPDLVLMDIAMPQLNGLEATTRIVLKSPEARVIILSAHATAEYARRAIRAGAAGYLLKDASPVELNLALNAVVRGETFLSPRVSKFIVADYASNIPAERTPLDRLTSRQREILQLIAEGRSRKDIAEKLCISVKTFDTYRAQMMESLDIHDVANLVRFAASVGLVPPANE
jgi:DNA-binding NarL/FixJ family response regulator